MTKDLRSLLVVDDNEVNRVSLGQLLKEEGYAVTLSADGGEALAALRHGPFDLILLDVAMPDLDGFEVLRIIRESHSATDLPVIMATASDHSENVIAALKLGANDYVTKPLDFAVVVARIETQMSLKRAVEQQRILDHHLSQRNQELETANRKLTTAYQKMKRDLEAAARIQQAFLPQTLPRLPGVSFAWKFQPCEHLAGDTLNIVQLDENHIGLYVLDVSGHGVAAALLSVTLSRTLAPTPADSSILLECVNGPEGPPGNGVLAAFRPTSPNRMVEALARRFPWDSATEQFFTILYGILDIRTGDFRYVSAGHPGLIHLTPDRCPVMARVSSFPIGIPTMSEEPCYHEERIQLQTGDRVYLYSDGVTEARNASRELFGTERLLHLVEHNRGSSLAESLRHITEVVQNWCGGSGFKDDLSILAVEYLR